MISVCWGTFYPTFCGILPLQIRRHQGSQRRRFSSNQRRRLYRLCTERTCSCCVSDGLYELIFRLGKNRVYRITKPCEIIVTGDENVLHTAVFEVCTNTCIVSLQTNFLKSKCREFPSDPPCLCPVPSTRIL